MITQRVIYTGINSLTVLEKDLSVQCWTCPVSGIYTNNYINVYDKRNKLLDSFISTGSNGLSIDARNGPSYDLTLNVL